MNKKMFRSIIFSFGLLGALAVSLPASVSADQHPLHVTCDTTNDPLGLNCVEHTGLSKTDPRIVVGRIIKVALGLIGTIFTVLTVYAGFLWMTAAGNEEQVTKARGIIMASVIGLVIILASYSITNFVLKNICEASATDGTPCAY